MPSLDYDVHAHYARKLLERNHRLSLPPPGTPLPTPAVLTKKPVRLTQEREVIDADLLPIGILGAG